MSLTFKDVDQILKLIDEAEFAEVKLELNGLVLHVTRRGAVGQSAASRPPQAPPAVPATAIAEAVRPAAAAPPAHPAITPPVATAVADIPPGMAAVRAPMAGTFYRAPSPGAKPFVEVGARVSASDTVCLIEVMKLFKSVDAGVNGRVAAILVPDATAIVAQQPLFLIDPA